MEVVREIMDLQRYMRSTSKSRSNFMEKATKIKWLKKIMEEKLWETSCRGTTWKVDIPHPASHNLHVEILLQKGECGKRVTKIELWKLR